MNIFVAGFGRCGTTAMMQLLWQGGAPVGGPAPAFEDTRLSREGTDLTWVRAHTGKVLKWIDPLHNPLPADIEAKTIWMERNFKDQARSQIKMVQQTCSEFYPGPGAVATMAKSMKRDRSPSLAGLRRRGPVLVIEFKHLLRNPAFVAMKVQDFLGDDLLPYPIDGAASILRRGPECQSDMWAEQATIAEARDADGHLCSMQAWHPRFDQNDNALMLAEFIQDYSPDRQITIFPENIVYKSA